MRELRLLFEGTSPLDPARGGLSDGRRPALPPAARGSRMSLTRMPLEAGDTLKAVEGNVYARLARRRRKAQMAARRQLGVHDDCRPGL